MVTGTGTHGIEGGVNEDQDSLLLVGAQERPDEGDQRTDAANGQGEVQIPGHL